MSSAYQSGNGKTDMLDVAYAMKYLKDKYHATVEFCFDIGGDGPEYGLLSIAAVAWCRIDNHPAIAVSWSRELTPKILQRMSEVLLDACYEIQSKIDGNCPSCKRGEAIEA